MNYFKRNEGNLEKYNVQFNSEELQTIRNEAIDDCSEITSHEYDDIMVCCCNRIRGVKNTTGEIYEMRNIRGEKIPNSELHHIQYDLYEFPYLVTLIDRLLSGDASALDEIYSPNTDREKKLQGVDLSKLNGEQNQLLNYYLRVQSMVQLDYVGSIDMQEVLKVQEFLQIESSEVKNPNIQKVFKSEA